jgi:3-phenylpropionate/trans-cinnamate dioxygenase ferredoxin subunit
VKHALFPADELAPGQIRRVTVDGLAIAVARRPDGTLSAVRDICPHYQARLSHGYMEAAFVAQESGQYVITERIVLRCPWHGYEFDLETGRCLADPERMRVRVYKVEVEDGTVFLERSAGEPQSEAQL